MSQLRAQIATPDDIQTQNSRETELQSLTRTLRDPRRLKLMQYYSVNEAMYRMRYADMGGFLENEEIDHIIAFLLESPTIQDDEYDRRISRFSIKELRILAFYHWYIFDEYSEAERILNYVVERGDDYALTDLGWIYEERDQYDVAFEFYMRALRQSVNNSITEHAIHFAITMIEKIKNETMLAKICEVVRKTNSAYNLIYLLNEIICKFKGHFLGLKYAKLVMKWYIIEADNEDYYKMPNKDYIAYIIEYNQYDECRQYRKLLKKILKLTSDEKTNMDNSTVSRANMLLTYYKVERCKKRRDYNNYLKYYIKYRKLSGQFISIKHDTGMAKLDFGQV
jgi:tetratricopeptide (TPR) repeat protein